jgi:catechol 2,3-dioxygenase-like lactoylglutathione lyase family enzyme
VYDRSGKHLNAGEVGVFESTRGYSGFAVDDLEKARQFYGEVLGLETSDLPMGMMMLSLPGGQEALVYHKPDFVPASYTTLNLEVDDAGKAADELSARGVELERYDGFDQDEKGIVRMEGLPPGGWFTDPAGNIIALHEPFPT